MGAAGEGDFGSVNLSRFPTRWAAIASGPSAVSTGDASVPACLLDRRVADGEAGRLGAMVFDVVGKVQVM